MEPIVFSLEGAKIRDFTDLKKIAECFYWKLNVSIQDMNNVYIRFNGNRASNISAILYFQISELFIHYTKTHSKISINDTTLHFYGQSQTIVDYIFDTFPNAKIEMLSSQFDCKNKKIGSLELQDQVGCYEGSTIENIVIDAILDPFVCAKSIPPQYIYSIASKSTILYFKYVSWSTILDILKYKLFILHVMNNNIGLVSSPVADPSLFEYINKFIL